MSRLNKILTLTIALLFTLVLAACGNKDVEQKLQEAYDALLLPDSDIYDDIALPTTGMHDVKITWESSNEEVISNEGKVNRPAYGTTEKGYIVVTLTATLKLDKNTMKKEFRVRVMELPEEKGGTVAGVLKQPKDTDVVLRDVIVFGKTSDGFYVYDDTGAIFVYTGSSDISNVNVGDKVEFYGLFTIYYDQPEVKDITGYTVISSGNTIDLKPTTKTLAEVLQFDTKDRTIYAQYITIEGVVNVEKSGRYTDVYIVDGENKVQINPNSDAAKVAEYDGKKVSLDVIIHSFRTDRQVWYLSYFDREGTLREVTMTDEEKLQAAYDSLTLPEVVATDIELKTKIGDVAITWTSSNESIIATDGTVTRPKGDDVQVTLTATLTLGDLQKTKEFTITVKAAGVSTIADVIANANKDEIVDIEGYVAGVIQYGYFLYDGTAAIYVYTGGNHDVQEGDQVRITGKFDFYNNDQPQINKPDNTELLTGDDAKYNAPTAIDTITIKDIVETDSKTKDIYGKYVRLTAKVDKLKDGDYDNFFLIDEEDNKVRIYHITVTEDIKAYKGNVITIDVFVYRYSSNSWEVVYIDGHTLESQLTDQEKINQVKEQLTLPETVTDALKLPNEMLGVSISWQSDNAAITINEDGSVTITQGDTDVTVKLTATLTIGDLTDTKEFTVVVKQKQAPEAISEARKKDENTEVFVEGVVTAVIGNNAFIQDDTAGIYLYYGSNGSSHIAVGNKVRIRGKINIYNNLVQIKEPDSTTLVETGVQVPDAKDYDSLQALLAEAADVQGQLVRLEGLIILEVTSGDSYSVVLTDDGVNKIEIRVDKYLGDNYVKQEFFELGKVINITAPLGQFKDTYQLMIANGSQQELVDPTTMQTLTYAKYVLDLGNLSAVTEDLDLPTTIKGIDGLTISWSSSNTDVIGNDGKVTRPAAGESDAVVTLTATLTLNDETTEKTFEVTVLAETDASQTFEDLIISEYIEGTGLNKAIEIYNGTGKDVDLSQYSLVLYTNGNKDNTKTLQLSGTLKHGEVFVVAHGQAIVEIKAVADMISNVIDFNGNDPVALQKNGETIDIVGVFGDVDFAKDKTLVRKSTVTSGSSEYDASEWIELPTNDFSNLGKHLV